MRRAYNPAMPNRRSLDATYEPFPNVPWRNNLQSQVELPLMVKALRVPKGRRILELGCGRGIGLVPLAELCEPVSIVGVDFDRPLLTEAQAHVSQLPHPAACVAGDIRRLPFAAEAFDILVDFGTCYHAGDPLAALAEVHRVLAPGGLFLYESPLSQALAHPIRTKGRRLPWDTVPDLIRVRRAGLWSCRVKLSRPRAGPESAKLSQW